MTTSRSDRSGSSLMALMALGCAVVTTALAGCASNGPAAPADSDAGAPDGALVCSVVAPTACPTPVVHYTDVAPIIQQHCVPCHSGTPGGPWPLTEYSHVADWQDIVHDSVLHCTMPPPTAGSAITDAERVEILAWIRCGYPP